MAQGIIDGDYGRHVFLLGADELTPVIIEVERGCKASLGMGLFLPDSFSKAILQNSGKNCSLRQCCGKDAFLRQLKLGFDFPLAGSTLPESKTIVILFSCQSSAGRSCFYCNELVLVISGSCYAA